MCVICKEYTIGKLTWTEFWQNMTETASYEHFVETLMNDPKMWTDPNSITTKPTDEEEDKS